MCSWCKSCCQQSAALLGTCLSSIKTMHQHIGLVTQSSFCAVRHRSSSVPTCGQPSQLITAWCSSVYTKYQSVLCTSCGSMLRHGLIFSKVLWTMRLISGKKDGKHVSMQKVFIMNTCCDVACWDKGWISAESGGWCNQEKDLKHVSIHGGHFEHYEMSVAWNDTTGSFHSHQCHTNTLDFSDTTSIRWMSSAFHKVVQWHFSGVMGKVTIRLQFVLFWDNVNNQMSIHINKWSM